MDTRHACLLYESTLALPVSLGRISFHSAHVRTRFDEDFREMAHFMVRVRDHSPAREIERGGCADFMKAHQAGCTWRATDCTLPV